MTPHRFNAWRVGRGRKAKTMPWNLCNGCGLVRLRNALTDWCARHGCDYDEHPGYRAAVHRLTR